MRQRLQVDNAQVLCQDRFTGAYDVCAADHFYRFPLKYKIQCELGYHLVENFPGAQEIAECTEKGDYTTYLECEDRDECAEETDDCNPIESYCRNNDGSFDCPCRSE